MAAIAVDVHFDVRHAESEHGGEVFHGPDGVDAVAGAGGGKEGRGDIAGNGWRGAIAGKGRGAGVEDTDEIGARGDAGEGVGLVEFLVADGGGGGEFGAGREAHDADFGGVELPLGGVGTHETDGLSGVVYGVALGVVAIFAEAVAEDDGVDAVVVEEGDEVRGFRGDDELVVAAAGGKDDNSAGVDGRVDGVEFDAGVVDADDGGDAARDAGAGGVDFGKVELLAVEQGAIGRIERQDEAAGEEGLGGVGLGSELSGEGKGQGRKQQQAAEFHTSVLCHLVGGLGST